MSGLVGCKKVGWLLGVDGFSESAMKKCVLDVQLMDGPGARECKQEYGPNGRGFDYGAEGFIKNQPPGAEKSRGVPSVLYNNQGSHRV